MAGYSSETIFFDWFRTQAETIECLLISGAPYWDIIELISTGISFKNGGLWYSSHVHELVS